jgi:hypothetical protein
MPEILLQQTHTTSVAVILDIPLYLIEKYLRARIHASTTSRSHRVATQILLLIGSILRGTMVNKNEHTSDQNKSTR